MLCSKGFDKHIISCIHHRSIMLKNFTAVQIPWLHLFISSPFSITPGNPYLSTISLVLLFQTVMQLESYRRYIAFSDWLLSLSNMYLSLRHTFLWLESSFFFFYHWIIFYCMDVPQFGYPFAYERISWLLLIFSGGGLVTLNCVWPLWPHEL